MKLRGFISFAKLEGKIYKFFGNRSGICNMHLWLKGNGWYKADIKQYAIIVYLLHVLQINLPQGMVSWSLVAWSTFPNGIADLVYLNWSN